MKTNMYKHLRIALVLLTMTLGMTTAHAQITFDDNVDDETPAAPIDGVIYLGLAAGAALGLRKKLKNEEK